MNTNHEFTSGNSQHSHDSDNGWIDWDNICLHFLQDDAHYGQNDYHSIQLIPPVKDQR